MEARWENSQQAVLLFSIPICITMQWPAEKSWCRSTECPRCSSTTSILTMTRAVRNSRSPNGFEKRGTETFNSQDIEGFAEVFADDVVFEAPGGLRGQGKAACLEFYGSWF